MSSTQRISKVKLRAKEEGDKLRKNAVVSWGIFFMSVAIGSVFASSMYGPIILGALCMILFQGLQLHNFAAERIGILGKAYSHPLVLAYVESGIDGVKDIDDSITKWESLTEEERTAKNKMLNAIMVLSFIALIVAVSGFFCGIFWILPA